MRRSLRRSLARSLWPLKQTQTCLQSCILRSSSADGGSRQAERHVIVWLALLLLCSLAAAAVDAVVVSASQGDRGSRATMSQLFHKIFKMYLHNNLDNKNDRRKLLRGNVAPSHPPRPVCE